MEVPQAPPASSLHPHDLTAERWICGGIDIGDPDADWYVEHKERRLYPWDARALYHRSPPTRLLASTEIIVS